VVLWVWWWRVDGGCCEGIEGAKTLATGDNCHGGSWWGSNKERWEKTRFVNGKGRPALGGDVGHISEKN